MTNSTLNSQAIAFYQANLNLVNNYGLRHLDDSADRAKFTLGKKLAEAGTVKTHKVAGEAANQKDGLGTSDYSKVHDYAGQAAIEARIEQGQRSILLSDLYDDVDANNGRSQNGVQWAVRRAMDAGILAKTTTPGKYRVVCYPGGNP